MPSALDSRSTGLGKMDYEPRARFYVARCRCFLIRQGYEATLPVSSSFCLTVPLYSIFNPLFYNVYFGVIGKQYFTVLRPSVSYVEIASLLHLWLLPSQPEPPIAPNLLHVAL